MFFNLVLLSVVLNQLDAYPVPDIEALVNGVLISCRHDDKIIYDFFHLNFCLIALSCEFRLPGIEIKEFIYCVHCQ